MDETKMSSDNRKSKVWLIILLILVAIMLCLCGVAVGLFLGWTVFPVQWVMIAPNSFTVIAV